jgi:redox-sensitive bicupin YhaK (pirin superfamily)
VNTKLTETVQLPRLGRSVGHPRHVEEIARARHTIEGAGFEVWRPFPGVVSAHRADPFFLLDQLGPIEYAPGAAVGAPWHPHRGFETVTYVLEGSIEHHDSNGGGGLIGAGATQWMTAGSGILHDEVPPQAFVRNGGRSHGVQLWVNLPASLKMTPPRYQAIEADEVSVLASHDGGAVVRLIAGELGGHAGPGSTHTPITYAHASLAPAAELSIDWNPSFNAMAYVLEGSGSAGPENRPVEAHDLVVFGAGDALRLVAGRSQTDSGSGLELLLLGGLPIREPIFHYGPFLMNTRNEVAQAIDDYQAGRMGVIPATVG